MTNPEVMNEATQSLYEDIYIGKANTTQLNKIDNYFEDLIDLISINDGLRRNKKEASMIMRKIKIIVDKMFNINIDLEIDYFPTIRYFAYTIRGQEIVNIIESQVKEIIINKDTGYHLIEVKKFLVRFESIALMYLKYPETLSKGSIDKLPNGAKRPLTGRDLTSILLHEIGHNIFVPFEFNQKNDGVYEFKVDNAKPIIVYEDKFPSFYTFAVFATSIIMPLVMVMGYLGTTFLTFVIFAKAIDKIDKNNYMVQEKNANTLPFQYGYGEEILYITLKTKWITDSFRSPIARVVDNFKRKLKLSKRDYEAIITRDILKMIDDELKNPNNDKEQIEYLIRVRKKYQEDIKDLQAELGIIADDSKNKYTRKTMKDL